MHFKKASRDSDERSRVFFRRPASPPLQRRRPGNQDKRRVQPEQKNPSRKKPEHGHNRPAPVKKSYPFVK